MNKWLKRISAVLLSFVMILGNILPSVPTYAAGASASGVASMTKNLIFTDGGTATVNLAITGHPASVNRTVPNDVVIIGDCSGSMGGSKIEALRKAIKDFSGNVNLSKHRIGVVAFESGTRKLDFTTDKTEIDTFVDTMVAGGGTFVGPAINAAISMLKSDKREGAKPTIILLTDGEASDKANMLTAAEAAKKEGFVFYTIALLTNDSDPENNATNLQLRKLATTEAHHHFVGVQNLDELYKTLADDVGVENPYNVIVTQKINDKFELVPNSANDNIPVPTINGNTLVWNMLEIKNTTINLHYSIKLKDSSIAAGSYKACSESYLTYETYDGDQTKMPISSPYVTVVDYVDPTILTMSPSSSNEGIKVVAKVTHTGMTYDDDFTVYIDGNKAEAGTLAAKYFKFVVPATLAPGKHAIKIVNHKRTVNVGEYTVNAVEKPVITMSSIDVTSGEEGASPEEKINVTNMSSYAADFAVFVGDKQIAAKSLQAKYFKFNIPGDLTEGSYAVKARNDGIFYPLGTYTVVKPAVPTVTYGPLTYTTWDETVAPPTQKITISEHVDYNNFSVTVNGANCALTTAAARYFKFKMPTLSAGTYEVKVIYKGTPTTIGTYTVTGVTPPDPVFGALPVTSGEEGDTPEERITFTTMDSYPADFAVFVGANQVSLTSAQGKYFKFKIPGTLSAGTYEVKVRANGKEYKIGDYTVNGKPVPDASYGALPVTSGEIGENPEERITYSSTDGYPADFAVYVGSQQVSLTSVQNKYFKFRIPNNLTAGTYEVKAHANGKDIKIGDYTVNAAPIPTITYGALTVPSANEGETPIEKITISEPIDYNNGFSVTVNGVVCALNYTGNKYFKFTIPSGLGAGTYPVTVTYGTDTIIGNYEVVAVSVPVPTFGSLSVTSVYEGSTANEKVTVTGLSGYPADFAVSVGGQSVSVTSMQNKYFKFAIPALAKGNHDVVVRFNGSDIKIGEYNVLEYVVPMFTYKGTSMSGDIVRVKVSNINYDNIKVYVGGTEVPLTHMGKSYFKFNAAGLHGPITVDYHSYTGIDVGNVP